MQAIIPLILSGGAGTRLWPLSTEERPKQFVALGKTSSLIENTVLRCRDRIFDHRPIVVSGDRYRFLIAEALRNLRIDGEIMLEPVARDSCAAVAAGCLAAQARSPSALVLVLAADHMIHDNTSFVQAVVAATADAEEGKLVTFGVKPTTPETAYGYIKPGEALRKNGCYRIDSFVEKPDVSRAEKYIREGYFWNSGNFLFRADVFLDELGYHAPEILAAVRLAYANSVLHGDFKILNREHFASSPRLSIDYAVMEKTAHAAIFPVNYQWSDVGSWDAVRDLLPKDEFGNCVFGDGLVADGANNLLYASDIETLLIGVEGLIVVATSKGVLVTREGLSEKLKVVLQGKRKPA
ncbi:MAG: mannose-1-phosphate guanylyltransferase/mannose-6-phosphate isomerase [Alphaproteobacteria bacterium]|nr:mannose-1-phosphate guanylyltransferase/mannose-6-phosphate isomerase [Alphaproteobacteria bacterium]